MGDGIQILCSKLPKLNKQQAGKSERKAQVRHQSVFFDGGIHQTFLLVIQIPRQHRKFNAERCFTANFVSETETDYASV